MHEEPERVLVTGGCGFVGSSLVKNLAAAAYARVDMVTRRGEFAVRGGMLDVFPPTEDHPIRVEFFGDEVEQMRWFAVAIQPCAGSRSRGVSVGSRKPAQS